MRSGNAKAGLPPAEALGQTAQGGGAGEPEKRTPLYLQVAYALRDEIVSGIYPFGSKFPKEEELQERFAVSRYTIREAVRALREEGLISTQQGVRSVVVPPPSSDSYILNPMTITDLIAYTTATRFVIDTIRIVTVSDRIAAWIGPGEWLAVLGFRHSEDAETPVCWTEVYINREFANVGRLLPRHTGPIFPLIEDLFAQKVNEVHQEIAATLVPAELAGRLEVKPDSPALEIRRWYKMAGGKVAQFTVSIHPASNFCYSTTMRRANS